MPLKDFKFFSASSQNCWKFLDTLVKPIVLYNSEVWGAYLKQREVLAHGTKVQLKKPTFVFVQFISESTPNAQMMLVERN